MQSKKIVDTQEKNINEINLLMMEYKNIHQKVNEHVDTSRHDTVQTLIIMGTILLFSLNNYYDIKYDIFVNIIMCILVPLVPLNLIVSVIATNIKICVYGEYLSIIEKKINKLFSTKDCLEIGESKKILNWEKWRIKYGIAKDTLVFFNEGILFIILGIGGIAISIIRLLYINDNAYRYIRIWLFLYPLPIAFYLTIILVLLQKLSWYEKRDLDQVNSDILINVERGVFVKKCLLKIGLFFVSLYIFIVILLLFFIPFSFYSYHKDNVSLQNQIIAHRGLHNANYPENTLLSFQNALDKNYAIELDVWMSKDNVPIVIHDNDLMRLCDTNQKITELSLEEIKKLKVEDKAEIPTLQEALDLVNGQVPVIIEIKKYFPTSEENQILANVLEKYEGTYTIQSFSPFPLNWFKQNYPTITRGQLLADWKIFSNRRIFCLRDNIFSMISMPDYIGYDRNVIKYASLNGARKHRIPIIVWLFSIDEIKCDNGKKYDGYLIEESFSLEN